MISLASISLDLYKLTTSQDASNAVVRTLSGTATVSGLLCSVQPLRGYEADVYARRGINADFQIFSDYDFDSDSNLSGGLKLGYVLKDAAQGFQYQVMGVEKSANIIIRSTPLYRILARRIVS